MNPGRAVRYGRTWVFVRLCNCTDEKNYRKEEPGKVAICVVDSPELRDREIGTAENIALKLDDCRRLRLPAR